MNANEIANKYRGSPTIIELLNLRRPIDAIKAIRNIENCSLISAKNAVDLIRGMNIGKVFTEDEVNDLIVRNAIYRLQVTMTDLETKAFRAKGLID